jgi:trk system potassium uptake protein TrkA
MYVVIAGAGLAGLALAERLVSHRHDVLIIDQDPVPCAYAREELGVMVHQGSATSMKTAESVGLGRADVAIGMMRDDALNLAFCVVAKAVGVPRRFVRMREKTFEEPYRLAGATGIASSVDPLVDQLMVQIEHPGVRGLMRLATPSGRIEGQGSSGLLDLFEVPIPEGAGVSGLTVEAIGREGRLPPGCSFIAVEHPGGDVEIARGPTRVSAGATAIMLATDTDLDRVVRALTQP